MKRNYNKQKDLLEFCQLVMRSVYNKLNTKNNFNKKRILDLFLSNETSEDLFRDSGLIEEIRTRIQAKRCLQVISLALINSFNYINLKKNLIILTNLLSSRVLDIIKTYIPLLNEIDQDLEISKWLPRRNLPKKILVNKKVKKCNKCLNLLPIDKFERKHGKRGENEGISSHCSICKECRIEKRLINLLKKKLKLILELFDGKCYECGVGLEYIASFEFHHHNPKIKKNSWNKVKFRSYDFIRNWAIKEEVVPLCGNCHSMKKASIFNDFKNIITLKNIFSKNAEEIDYLVKKAINDHPNYIHLKDYKRTIKIQIKKYLKKRYIYTKLFKGRCIACEEIVINDFLPALELHHRKHQNNEKKSTWREISYENCKNISFIIRMENCICLCTNCHKLVRSKLNIHIDNILRELRLPRDLSINIINRYKSLMKKINDFLIPYDIDNPKSCLELDFSYPYDIWKIRLFQLYNYTINKKSNIFSINELTEIFGFIRKKVKYNIDRFKSFNYVKEFELNDLNKDNGTKIQKYYYITELGLLKARDIEKNHPDITKELKLNLLSIEKYIKKQKKWIL